MRETKTYCDACKKELKDFDGNRMNLDQGWEVLSMYGFCDVKVDLCHHCANKVLELIGQKAIPVTEVNNDK